MNDFAEALRKDKSLVAEVTAALEKIAEAHGLTIDKKNFPVGPSNTTARCGGVGATYITCTW